ncbi:MAG: DUF1343 domain-containing protein [Weeksellaceae bacterium]|jgi:uncharacterized protein YbbC (DUF1343 family)|nr:DUF1343 domain-containing protein [Weeksellaceae bacterium]MDX9704583.1 DUF1343 domain-containing protein [Weeksellaceae bacterium]
MCKKLFKYTLIALFLSNFSYAQHFSDKILTGAEQVDLYLPELEGKRVGVVTNQTGIVTYTRPIDVLHEKQMEMFTESIIDFLLYYNIQITKIFSPEHGFRGDADAGETVKSGKDVKTGLPIVSLYGKNKKPTQEQYADLDVILFDIQDVGARFYTYISTLHYVMETAAEVGKKVIVLDRPNPNGHYVDGPVLDKKYKSFVGMHPVPIVYGMTIGEYALMINGEKWLTNGIQCDLTVIPLKNYTHDTQYSLPVKPSPNLPNDKSINLYPSTCFFEAINGSEGRGTDKPFQVYGSPYLKNMSYQFVPKPNVGAKEPRFNGQVCYGEDLSDTPFLSEIKLEWLIKAYQNYEGKESFWIKNSGKFWIDTLAGTDELRKQIEQGFSEEEIKKSWQEELDKFKKIRAKYLLYR